MPNQPYRESRAPADLAPFVACYWSLRTEATPGAGVEHVVPDGCLDFLFDLTTGRGRLVGTMTRPLAVDRAASVHVLGVRLRPGAVRAFMDLEADAVTDGFAGLAEAGAVIDRCLPERLADTDDEGCRLAVLDAALRSALGSRRGRDDALARRAAHLVLSSPGAATVEDVAETVGLGRRQLERRFKAAVGVTPRTARRIGRFQAAVAVLTSDSVRPLSWVALDAGYHDQAHFTREFGRLAGETPTEYRARRATTVRRDA